MRKYITIAIIGLFVLAGCQNGKAEEKVDELSTEVEQLQQELKEQRDEIKKLQTKNKTLREDKSVLETKANRLSRDLDDLKQRNKQIKAMKNSNQYARQKVERRLETILNQEWLDRTRLREETGVFNRSVVQEGNKVGALTVSEITKKEQSNGTRYSITFTGNYEVSGRLTQSALNGKYVLIPDSSDLHNVPHTLYSRGDIQIDNTEKLKEAIGSQLKEVDYENSIPVTLRFQDYNYYYIPESHAEPYATFVEVLNEQ